MSTEISTNPIKDYMMMPKVQEKFHELLGENSTTFVTSVLQVVNSNPMLATAEPSSVFQSAALAAVLNLPINNNIGHAYIVPYQQSYQENGQWKKKNVAQFQIGWKGLVQLAIRSGQYQTISVTEIYEGQLIKDDPLFGFEFDFSKPSNGKVIGFAAYFKLKNGFDKMLFTKTERVIEHGKKFSKSYDKTTSPWQTNFNSMAKKTVLKSLITGYGPMSLEMQKSIESDQAVIDDDGNPKYVDNPNQTPESVININGTVVDPDEEIQ